MVKLVRSATGRAVDGLVWVAAQVWKVAPTVVELAGVVCLVVAGSFVHPAAAWTVAGVGLVLRSLVMDRARAEMAAKRRPLSSVAEVAA
ncbi:MAG: hypothetical protein GY745_22895 [Actinomycetia bacterium]|nr:hypothetical protein [Actinomycetes bacterium]